MSRMIGYTPCDNCLEDAVWDDGPWGYWIDCLMDPGYVDRRPKIVH